VKILQKVLGGYFFLTHTVDILSQGVTVNTPRKSENQHNTFAPSDFTHTLITARIRINCSSH